MNTNSNIVRSKGCRPNDHALTGHAWYWCCPWLISIPPNTAATFDVFSRLQVANDGLFQTFFESAPNGSDHIDVWLGCIFAQTASPVYLVATFLPRSPVESKPKSCLRADITGDSKTRGDT